MPQRAQRPLSAYNVFFKVQRYLLINDRPDLQATEQVYQICDEIHHVVSKKPNKKQTKRLHRKSHGKIGFAELGKIIGQRWRSCSSDIKRCFEQIAQEEKSKYYKTMKDKRKSRNCVEASGKRTVEQYISEESKESSDESESKLSGATTSDSNFTAMVPSNITSHSCNLEDQKLDCDLEPLPYKIGEAPSTQNENEIDFETFEFVVSLFGSSTDPK